MTELFSNSKKIFSVLILDDDLNLCNVLQDILQEYQFKTAIAQTPEEAVAIAQTFKPEVALVDFNLGATTGLEAGTRLKALDPDLPLILMTAYPSLDLAVKAIQSEIYDFLSKPVDTPYLLRSINKALEKRALSLENKQLILSLQQTNSKLERLNLMKSKFLSVVTHDLRTPLTSIRGYAELLKISPDMSKQDEERCYVTIEKSVEHMNNLISNLMDMVSMEAGQLRVELNEMDFSAVCKELETSLSPVAANKKIDLTWSYPSTPLLIQGDSLRLAQVFNNLISNAFKHTPANGKIAVQVEALNENAKPVLKIQVRDNGAGIAKEDQSKIFDQFFQVESSPTRRSGLGLGLSITKEIITAHHGQIGVKSDGPGKGSAFWFTLPQKPL